MRGKCRVHAKTAPKETARRVVGTFPDRGQGFQPHRRGMIRHIPRAVQRPWSGQINPGRQRRAPLYNRFHCKKQPATPRGISYLKRSGKNRVRTVAARRSFPDSGLAPKTSAQQRRSREPHMIRYAIFDDDRGEIYLPDNAGFGYGQRAGCSNCPEHGRCTGSMSGTDCPSCDPDAACLSCRSDTGCALCLGFENFHDCSHPAGGPDAVRCLDCTPTQCARWEKSPFVCPVCLEFAGREQPVPFFHESALIVRNDGLHLCPDCGETYRDTANLALRAIENLKDALDDRNWELINARGAR